MPLTPITDSRREDAPAVGGAEGDAHRAVWKRRLRDSYASAGVLIFLAIVVCCWVSYIETDEELYFLGPRRIANPSFLAADFTWSRLPPTSALFDHLVGPLFRIFGEFTIANLGRALFWGLMAWSIARLARTSGSSMARSVTGRLVTTRR